MRVLILCIALIIPMLAQQPSTTVIFVSDTQQPLWIETLRLQEHHNEHATRKLYHAIAHDSSADAIFHLGDITALGMFDSYWKDFDLFHSSLRIPFYPVIGNHDYYPLSGAAEEQFYKRFSGLKEKWYAVVIQAVGFIALNSNFSKLSDEEKQRQQTWFQEQLNVYENDSTINAVVVLCHHSPYTNSTIVDPSRGVQRNFVPPFLMHQKTVAFLSGHAHAYEHFQKSSKEYLVIGGGGGLLHPLLQNSERRYEDLFHSSSSIRFFHYVECRIQPSSLLFLTKKLRGDFSGFDIVDSLSVPFPL